jgi:Domain of Unknown Function with PDB structure (DUF3857)/Transglutaminase-like superfamily
MFPKYLNYLLLTVSACWFAVEKTNGQDKNIPKELYIAASIPDSLKENANSIVRYSRTDLTVKAPGKAMIKYRNIVTILNEKGDHEAAMVLSYNKKYDNYSKIEMLVYNEKGDVIKKYYKSDMYDGAAGNDETLVSDERFLAVKQTIATYPITIEQEYEEDITSLLDLGSWDIQKDEQAVQNASYHISIDATAGFRYMNKNIAIKPQDSAAGNSINYYWKVSNLKAIKLEEKAEKWRVLPRVEFASDRFEFYGSAGDFSTWQNFGKWQKLLIGDASSLNPQREEEIRKMTDSIKSDKEKAKFLYNYMQQSMRYVSVQLGIGGLKPFSATFVDQKKYGDCKALSNYMSALLKAVNIPSCYAIINAEANQEPADPKFPFNSFNHVILCIPFKGDTTWLECTSSTQQFGKLGPFTENRRALLITEDGGKLVSTPRSVMQDNQFNSEVHIALDAEGGAKAHAKILSTGEYRSDYIGVSSLKTDEQKEYFIAMFNMKQPSVFEFKPSADKNGEKEIDIDLEYDKFCDVAAGNKQFYRPHVFDLVAFTVPIEEKRKSDYYFQHPLQKSCVTTIDLPAGFEVETLPVNQSLKFTYGNYEVKYVYDAVKNQVTSTAKFNITNQVIPAAIYTEMQQYLDAVAKAQNKKLVIRRKA